MRMHASTFTELYNFKQRPQFLSYFRYFEKINAVSWDHLALCVFPLKLLRNGSANTFSRQRIHTQ
jgi:hypothetical protein